MKNGLFLSLGLILTLSVPSFGNETGVPNPLAAKLHGKSCRIYDEPAVSHAKADDELGAIACLGYLHARDRAWQMDFLRRIAQGRKSELFGFKTLQDDLQMRMLGLDRKARELFAQMTEEQRAPFWAYAYGANQGLATDRAKNAYEFRHYGYQPDEWTPVNSLQILLLQSFDQTQKSFTQKLVEGDRLVHHGDEAPVLFSRKGLPWSTTILKAGEYPAAPEPASTGEHAQEDLPMPVPVPVMDEYPTEGVGHGSNNWALAPQRSLTGNAFVASDPHLDMKHPPFWYWAHVEGGRLDAIGASLPGVPMVASGSNRHLAWGLTNSYFDVAELAYLPKEDLSGANSRYRRPVVWVRVAGVKLPFFFVSFQRTKQGWPVLPISGVPSGKALVLRWAGFEIEPKDLNGIFELMIAGSAREADLAFSHVGLPSWNFTFADTQGAIGYRTVGKLPKRKEPLPYGVPDRRLDTWAPWTYLTADEAPHVLQPSRGYVVTANNKQWPAGSLYRDGRNQSSSFRAFRIEELLNQTPKHDRASIQAVQCDQQAVDARFVLRRLLSSLRFAADAQGGLSPRESAVYQALEQWDFNAAESCRQCGVWVRWTDLFLDAEHLNMDALYRSTRTPPSEAFQLSLLKTFREALDDLQIPPSGELKTWGEIHKNPFRHFSGDRYFDVPGIPTGGVENSVNPGTASWDSELHEFIQKTGASQRLVVELSDPPAVYAVLAGPNLDVEKPNLADPDGPWMKWKRCELEKRHFPFDWASVQAQAVTF